MGNDNEEASDEEMMRAKLMSRAALRLILNICGDMMLNNRAAGLDPLDYLLALAVGDANVSHLASGAEANASTALLVEPDEMRRGIRRAAIARATGLPLETVRRRINNLVQKGVLIEREDGVILSADNPYKIGMRMDRILKQAQQVERMFRELKQRGVVFD